MSWAKLDDRANEHRKQLAAGGEACWLWACGLMYANRQPARDGFIPELALAILYPSKTPKRLAAKLVEVGLWEKTKGGYQIHDFEEWNKSKDQLEAEREATRQRVAEHRRNKRGNATSNGVGNGDGNATSNGVGNGDGNATSNGVGNGVTPLHVPDPLHSDSTPTPSQQAAAPKPPAAAAASSEPRIPCPPDLDLTQDQRGTLETALIPGWAVDSVRLGFVTSERGDLGKTMTLTQWRKCLSQAVIRTWNDPRRRPKPPEEPTEPQGPNAFDKAMAAAGYT